MRRKLYIRKIEFYYKKEVRIFKKIPSMRRQLYHGMSKKFFWDKLILLWEGKSIVFENIFLGKFCFYWKKWNLYLLFTFLLKSPLSDHFPIEISSFWSLSYWNLLFLITFLLKSLLSLYFSIEISTFSLLFYWNLLFLITFLLKSLLSLYFSIEISTFSLLFYWNLLFLTTFLMKSLLSESSKTKKNLGNFWFLQFTVSSKREKTKHFLGVFWFLGS